MPRRSAARQCTTSPRPHEAESHEEIQDGAKLGQFLLKLGSWSDTPGPFWGYRSREDEWTWGMGRHGAAVWPRGSATVGERGTYAAGHLDPARTRRFERLCADDLPPEWHARRVAADADQLPWREREWNQRRVGGGVAQ